GPLGLRVAEPIAARSRADEPVSLVLEDHPQGAADRLLVVDDQDGRLHSASKKMKRLSSSPRLYRETESRTICPFSICCVAVRKSARDSTGSLPIRVTIIPSSRPASHAWLSGDTLV